MAALPASGCTTATPVVAVTTGKENVSLLIKEQLEIRERTQEKGYAKLHVNIFFAPTVWNSVEKTKQVLSECLWDRPFTGIPPFFYGGFKQSTRHGGAA